MNLIRDLNLASLTFKPIPESFIDAVNICNLSGNAENIRGVAVTDCEDGACVYETDSTRVCINKLSEHMDPFWVDDSTFNNAFKVGTPSGYCVSDAWLHLKYADGTIFSAKRKDHSAYPFDSLATFPKAFETAQVVVKGRLPSNIAEAVSRVAILASGVDKKNARLVRMTFRKDELELYAEKMGGEASETVPWETPLEEDPQGMEVWVNTSFLLEASNKVMDFTLCYMDVDPTAPPSPSLVFQSGEFMLFVQGATPAK